MGVKVAVVCSICNFGLVCVLGVDEVIDYICKDFMKGIEIYDFIYDIVGKSFFNVCKLVFKDNG